MMHSAIDATHPNVELVVVVGCWEGGFRGEIKNGSLRVAVVGEKGSILSKSCCAPRPPGSRAPEWILTGCLGLGKQSGATYEMAPRVRFQLNRALPCGVQQKTRADRML